MTLVSGNNTKRLNLWRSSTKLPPGADIVKELLFNKEINKTISISYRDFKSSTPSLYKNEEKNPLNQKESHHPTVLQKCILTILSTFFQP